MGPGVPDKVSITTTSTCDLNTPDQNIQDQDDKVAANNAADQKVKNYSKSYAADAYTRLDINNRYGKVSVKTWNKNEFRIDVQVKVSANKTGDANDLLNSISIDDKKQDQLVTFKTNINKESATSLLNSKTKFRKVEINYTVYMPAKNALSITNKWGDVDLPDMSGKLMINCSYGDLVAKSLTNEGNVIKITSGDAQIASLQASDLDISSGTLTLGWADKLNADMSYSSAKIGRLSTSGIINVKYGDGVQIIDIDKNLKNLSVNSNSTAVKVGLNNNENADFNVTVHYGTFSTGNHTVRISKKTIAENSAPDDHGNATQNFKGHVGKGDVAKVININSNYSSVKFE